MLSVVSHFSLSVKLYIILPFVCNDLKMFFINTCEVMERIFYVLFTRKNCKRLFTFMFECTISIYSQKPNGLRITTEPVLLIMPYKWAFNDILNSVIRMFRKVCSTESGREYIKRTISTAKCGLLPIKSYL